LLDNLVTILVSSWRRAVRSRMSCQSLSSACSPSTDRA